MRRLLIPALLASLSFASTAHGTSAPPTPAFDLFTVSGIRVDATAQSPRAARDLAMTQGRPLAWSKLLQRLTVQGLAGTQPPITDNRLLGIILSVEVSNERHNTTRYVADVTFHFNPNAVRQLMRASSVATADVRSEPVLVIPAIAGETGDRGPSIDLPRIEKENEPVFVDDFPARLTANVQFDTMKDWATLRARLGAVKTVSDVAVVGFSLHEAQIDITYSGQLEPLQAALADYMR